MIKKIWTVAGLAFLLVIMLFVIPINTSPENCHKIADTAEYFEAGSSHDIIVRLKNVDGYFYINRGLERGLTIDQLNNELQGREIELWYARSWKMKGGHVTKLQTVGKDVYNEWSIR